MSTPRVFLMADSPAAHLLLQTTIATLGDFPGIRVEHVNKSATDVSSGEWPSDGNGVAVLAANSASSIAGLQKRLGLIPLIVIPTAKSPSMGRKMLEAAGSAGAATVALNEAGARNAALLVVAMFAANGAAKLRLALDAFRARQTATVLKIKLPGV